MLAELSKRRVLRVISGYAVVCFVVLQIADVTFEPLEISDRVLRAVIALMLLGFPIVTYLAWTFDIGEQTNITRTGPSPTDCRSGYCCDYRCRALSGRELGLTIR